MLGGVAVGDDLVVGDEHVGLGAHVLQLNAALEGAKVVAQVQTAGLDGRKMSKSYGNAINISMTAEETAKRIKKSQTDSERMITFDPENRPGVSGLLSTAAICTGRSEVEIAEEIGMGGSGQLKKYVTEAVNEYFAPIRERRQRYENDLDYVKDVLHEGNRRANEIAEQTLAEVRDAMGMVY